jgi:hypothetical protein
MHAEQNRKAFKATKGKKNAISRRKPEGKERRVMKES